MMLLIAFGMLVTTHAAMMWFIAAIIIFVTIILDRSLFYALVIPTTMPGAFFWKNKGFEEHARETGLANWKQVGVLPEIH